MLTKQTKTIVILVILPLCIVLAGIGLPVINTGIYLKFDVNPHDTNYVGEVYLDPITARAGTKVPLPQPIRPSYRFEGWSTDQIGKNVVTSAKRAKMQLYAVWSELNPVATIYVDGIFVRSVEIPLPSKQSQTGVGTNEISRALLPQNNLTPLSWNNATSNIIGAYNLNDFLGYYWFDKDDTGSEIRRELTYENNGSGGKSWYLFPSGALKNKNLVGPSNPIQQSLKTDVAFNMVFGTEIGDNIQNVGITCSVKYLRNDGTEIENYTIDKNTVGGQPNPYAPKYGSSFTLPDILNGALRIGWRIEGTNDVYRVTVSENNSTRVPFYLSPRYYNEDREIVFREVYTNQVGSGQTAMRGSYDKMIVNGELVYSERYETGLQFINMVDFPKFNGTATFDFGGGEDVKDTNSIRVVELKTGVKYPSVDPSNLRITKQVSGGQTTLPLATNYGVGGKVFAGWRSGADGKIYSGGMHYLIPRGTVGDGELGDNITFTAVWVNARQLVTLNYEGGTEQPISKFYKPAGKGIGDPAARITLPTPTRHGYTFLGWYDMNSGLKVMEDYYEFRASHRNLIARWSGNDIKYKFSTDAPEVAPRTVKFGDTIGVKREQLPTGAVGVRLGANNYNFSPVFLQELFIRVDNKFNLNEVNILAPL